MEIILDPFNYVKDVLSSNVFDVVKEIKRESIDIGKCNTEVIKSFIEIPPREEFGDLAIPLPRIMRSCGINDMEGLAKGIISRLSSIKLLKRVNRANVYINTLLNESEYANVIKDTLRHLGNKYGIVKVSKPLRVVVEFVSANPIHPLHIGSGRNAALGDFIANLLESVGHVVERRYYVNDLGLQVAHLVYGYLILGKPKVPKGIKVDHFMGLLYAATSIILEIRKLKSKAEEAKKSLDYEEYSRIMTEISKLMSDLQSIRDKIPNITDKLIDEIMRRKDPEREVAELMRKYEEGDKEVVKNVREVVSLVLEGIKETLAKLNVKIDKWDWESDLIRKGLVKEILIKARNSHYFTLHKGAPALDFNKVVGLKELKRKLGIPEALDIPPLILARSDGTTLYTTRDIAYSIVKFREFNADKVINVIAIEQTLAQSQLKLALYILGYEKEAQNLIHYEYEMVNLPGMSMSSRRGKYVTVDEILDQLKIRVKEFAKERGTDIDDHEALKIARSAFKYMMLSTSPKKVITFDVEKALDISRNSGPYLQYTYARARSVLEKYGRPIEWDSVDVNSFNVGLRRRLLMLIGMFPSIIRYVSKELHSEDLISYLNSLADTFNSWYDTEPIIRESIGGVRNAKLMLTYAVKVILENGLRILGLDVLPRV